MNPYAHHHNSRREAVRRAAEESREREAKRQAFARTLAEIKALPER